MNVVGQGSREAETVRVIESLGIVGRVEVSVTVGPAGLSATVKVIGAA